MGNERVWSGMVGGMESKDVRRGVRGWIGKWWEGGGVEEIND